MVRDVWPGAAEPKQLIDRALLGAVTPTVRPAGFKRSSRNWYRHQDGVTHVINAQASPWNAAARDYVEDTSASFTCNLGVHLDALETPGERNRAGFVPVNYCHVYGRVGAIMSTGDYWWRMSTWEDLPTIIDDLSRILRDYVLPFFDQLDGYDAVAAWSPEAPPGFFMLPQTRATLARRSDHSPSDHSE
jgi:hypothetical protein